MNKLLKIGLIIVGLMVIGAIFAPSQDSNEGTFNSELDYYKDKEHVMTQATDFNEFKSIRTGY